MLKKGSMEMDYKKTGLEILDLIGGKENIAMLTHCATRLRLEFNDSSKVQAEKIESMPGVISVVDKGGQFQIIIGNEVQQVYRVIMNERGIEGENKGNQNGQKKEKKGIFSEIVSVISTTFTPFIPAIIGAGMIKAILAVLVLTGLLTDESQTFFILDTVADAAFFFMPVLLAYGASIKFATNPVLSMTIAGVLLHPNWSDIMASGEALHFIGIPLRLTDYAGSVLPIIITVWLMSYVERFAEKVSPSIIKFFMKPMLILLITAPLALVVVGPLGTYLNDLVAFGADSINSYASWLIPMLMGMFQPFLLITGTAWAMTPIATSQLSLNGEEIMNGPGMLASNIAQGAATLAVAVKTKNKQLKQIAGSAGFTALVGITEPSLFGVTLKLKRPLIAAMIGGGVAGVYAGLSGLVRYAFVSPGLAGIPAFIGKNPMNIVHALITIVIAFVVSFIAAMILGFEDPVDDTDSLDQKKKSTADDDTKNTQGQSSADDHINIGKGQSSVDDDTKNIQRQSSINIHVGSPLSGQLVSLSDVSDDVFSSGLLGKGVAIKPTKGEVIAPVAGEVVTLLQSKHAIGIQDDNGLEILIHVGIDTVNLNGEHFEAFVKQGDRVEVGDKLVEFDMEGIQGKGFDLITPIILTNHDQFETVELALPQDIEQSELIMTVKQS